MAKIYKLTLNYDKQSSSIRVCDIEKETNKMYKIKDDYHSQVRKDECDEILDGHFSGRKIIWTADESKLEEYQTRLYDWAIYHYNKIQIEANIGLIWATEREDFTIVRRRD
jgi:hypothetical protein